MEGGKACNPGVGAEVCFAALVLSAWFVNDGYNSVNVLPADQARGDYLDLRQVNGKMYFRHVRALPISFNTHTRKWVKCYRSLANELLNKYYFI